MGTHTKESCGRRLGVLAVVLVIGLTLLAALPASTNGSIAAGSVASGAQAFSEPASADPVVEATGLGRDAIAFHALIEYVLAPRRSAPVLEPERAEPSAQIVAAAAPATPQTTPTTVVPTPAPAQPTPAPIPTATPAAVVATPVPVQPAPVVPTLVPPLPATSATSRGQAALARMPLLPGSVGFTIEFLPARGGYGGLTYPDSRRIEIYVDEGWSDARLAHVVAHEIGHAVDMARNSRSDHERWRAARGIPSTTKWWADPYTSDFATPGGDFAECFAAWAVGTSATRSEFGSCAGTGGLMGELVWG